jgi:hypothetical protein
VYRLLQSTDFDHRAFLTGPMLYPGRFLLD